MADRAEDVLADIVTPETAAKQKLRVEIFGAYQRLAKYAARQERWRQQWRQPVRKNRVRDEPDFEVQPTQTPKG